MQSVIEQQKRVYWNGGEDLSSKYLGRDAEKVYPGRWSYTPFPIGIQPNPVIENAKPGEVIRAPVVDKVIGKLITRLTGTDFGNSFIRDLPVEYWDRKKRARRDTTQSEGILEPEILPRLIIRPGTGRPDDLYDPLFYLQLPDPKPLLLYISATDKLDQEKINFHSSRGKIDRGASHNGVVFEVSFKTNEITGAWWMSTQGNYQIIRGTEDEVLDSVAMRVAVHYGDTFVTERSDYIQKEGEPFIDWQDWKGNTIHHDLHEMAQKLRDLNLLDDQVDLSEYIPENERHNRMIMSAINRSALGEGMYSAKTGKVVAVSPSGGGKVIWLEKSEELHLIPVSHITTDGYMVYTPNDGTPIKIEYVNPSVEARENLDAYIMRQLFASGRVASLAEYEKWQDEQLEDNNPIPVYQKGTPQEDFVIVHLHGCLTKVDLNKVEVVEPDFRLYPRVDMACGTEGGNGALRSALAQSKWFTTPYQGTHFLEGDNGDKTIVVCLPGHGIAMIGRNPQAIVRAIEAGDVKINRPADTV